MDTADFESPEALAEEHLVENEPRSARRGLRFAAAGTALALIAGLVAGVWWYRRVPVEEGYGSYGVGLGSMDPKDTSWSMAAIQISDPGGDVRILSIEPEASPNVEYLGAYAIWPADVTKLRHSGGMGFPLEDQPKKYRHSIEEVIPEAEFDKIADKEQRVATITVGLRIASGDVGVLNGFLVTYRAGGKKKKEFFDHTALGCVRPHPCGESKELGSSSYYTFQREMFEQYGFDD